MALALAFAIKTAIEDPAADTFLFVAQKSMYGGKRIAAGDLIYLFHSENAGGHGLCARGRVVAAKLEPRRPDLVRQTPRVTITVRRTGLAARPLGRRTLKPFVDWNDERPETELNFKLYRQATDKVVGLSEASSRFLARYF